MYYADYKVTCLFGVSVHTNGTLVIHLYLKITFVSGGALSAIMIIATTLCSCFGCSLLLNNNKEI